MGCQNGKTINQTQNARKAFAKNLIEEIITLQKNILQTNMYFQIQNTINENKQASFEKLNEGLKNLTNSLKTNDNSINFDLNTAFIEQMKVLQNESKDLLTKAACYLRTFDDKTAQSIGCLYEFAFNLQLESSSTGIEQLNKDGLKELGDLCESVIIN